MWWKMILDKNLFVPHKFDSSIDDNLHLGAQFTVELNVQILVWMHSTLCIYTVIQLDSDRDSEWEKERQTETEIDSHTYRNIK